MSPGDCLARLRPYFTSPDAALPEIEIAFADAHRIPQAVAHLFAAGGRVANAADIVVWSLPSDFSRSSRPFAGLADVELVARESLEPFCLLLAGIRGDNAEIPELGVLVRATELTIDIEPGWRWSDDAIRTMLRLLRDLEALGGVVSAPYWGRVGEQNFLRAFREDAWHEETT
jgi:hypothetical protein